VISESQTIETRLFMSANNRDFGKLSFCLRCVNKRDFG